MDDEDCEKEESEDEDEIELLEVLGSLKTNDELLFESPEEVKEDSTESFLFLRRDVFLSSFERRDSLRRLRFEDLVRSYSESLETTERLPRSLILFVLIGTRCRVFRNEITRAL